ncbi:hypothetical protein Xekj_00628 [Xenorhabdus sp. KJ12.1]|nr:hypothetical protein Xekj_00628 [Xenorhabdus sp. KJ12.1]
MLDDQVVSAIDILIQYKNYFIVGIVVFYLILLRNVFNSFMTYRSMNFLEVAHKNAQYYDQSPELTRSVKLKSLVNLILNFVVFALLSICGYFLFENLSQ